ncbi:hypothetical protein P3X46_021765 [Hevea brasiliensis]|uniref:Uncharacterized protein n=1 Tax=Hevea brasiliensis TaxID=3981 RepID=A0ABQ9LGL5_HEVBR|nr:uncharacterized protein LOC131171082 [Hevea brasiliensis]KAJ9167089.1 hypothetical protein P3X46_021765 [Hevea brasiliensis]
MNGYREDNSCCYFHPKEVVTGVCPLCLNERLLILAAKQGQLPSSRPNQAFTTPTRKPSISLPKIFALGSLLNRLEFRHWKSDNNSDKSDASTSPEESFISIKFEENGAASWEKGTVSNKVTLEQCAKSWNHDLSKENKDAKQAKDAKETMSVIEHAKPRGSLRWRKRIGHLFQVIRWKRSNKGNNVCHVGTKVEGVKVRKGWIRTLTKRRTKE